MEIIKYVLVTVMMVGLSVEDIVYKRVKILHLLGCIPVTLFSLCISYCINEVSLVSVIVGVLISTIILLIAIVTRQIGMGDIVIIYMLALSFGGKILLCTILMAGILVNAYGMIGIVARRITLKSSVAFIPFLTLGMLISLRVVS